MTTQDSSSMTVSAQDTTAQNPTGSMVSSSIELIPSFALEVLDLSVDQPANSITIPLLKEYPLLNLLKVDRSALLKLRRHKEVRYQYIYKNELY